MDVLSTLKLVKGIFAILDLFVWARVILSWIPHNQYNEITRTVFNVTEPLLKPIRDLIPTSSINIDISPFILLFALNMAESLALRTFVY
ncbi:YggT family protein [bacterium]|jgi:YggT family protein|nr:YggT family protein [bacterium]MBT5733505.1 YggT family protein [bacterium]MBT6776471.1 YggT family protein [bacterium]|tara:strand:+ start:1226 stop:1492 length:267 start_codon:yes stop_codon:yes gene_type:complete